MLITKKVTLRRAGTSCLYKENEAADKMRLRMAFRTLACLTMVSLMLCGQAQRTLAQSVTSGGITITITKAAPNQRNAILQFIATNKTKTRIYLMDARGEVSQNAFLGSGAQLQSPSIVGLEQCQEVLSFCINENISLEKYSYIEPEESLAFGFTYKADSNINPDDTLSFTVALFGRASQVNGDPAQAGAPHALRYPFVHVPLNRP
jgi:hypothetical protein